MKHILEEVKLSNGTKGLLVHVPGSEAVGMEIWFNSGFRYSDHNKYEMPHITEHLLVSANEAYPDSMAFKKEIEKNGAGFNAFTSSIFNGYQWWCADFEVERILSLAIPQLTKPLITSKDVATERSRVKEELEGYRSDHASSTEDNLDHAFYGIPDNTISLNQLGSITAVDMHRYYVNTHTANNARFFATGNLNGKNRNYIIQGFERLIAGLPVGTWKSPKALPVNKLDHAIIEERNISQIYYRLRFRSHILDIRKWAAGSLLMVVLHSYLPSSLFGRVYEKGLAYHINSGFGYDSTESALSINWSVSPKNISALFATITKCLSDVIDGKIDLPEVKAARQILTGQTKLRYQTPGSILSFYAEDYMLFDQLVSLEEWTKLKLSIKPAELATVAAEMVKGRDWALSLVGPIKQQQAAELYASIKKLAS